MPAVALAKAGLLSAFCFLLFSPLPAHAHRLNVDPASVEHYIMLTPQTNGMAVLFDKHLGELASRTAAVRIDANRNGRLEEDELWNNLRLSTPGYLNKLSLNVTFDGESRKLPLRTATGDLNRDGKIYIVTSPDEQKQNIWTIRMRWKLFAPWPESLVEKMNKAMPYAGKDDHRQSASNAIPKMNETVDVEHFDGKQYESNGLFLVEFATRFDSYPALFSQITVQPAADGLKILGSDVPAATEVPLPPDEPEPLEDGITSDQLPRVTRANLHLARQRPESTPVSAVNTPAVRTTDTPAIKLPQEIKTPAAANNGFFAKTEASLRGRMETLFMPPRNIAAWIAAIALCLLWGAIHAFAPGHGKTIVSAALLGMQAKYRHAVILGLLVTLTHTAVVLVLAVAAVVLKERFTYPEWLQPLGAIMILLVGLNQIRIGLMRLLAEGADRRPQTADCRPGDGECEKWKVEGENKPAPLPTLPAPSSTLPAPSSTLPAPCSTLPAPCSPLPAPCSPLPAPCSPLPAPRSSPHTTESSSESLQSAVCSLRSEPHTHWGFFRHTHALPHPAHGRPVTEKNIVSMRDLAAIGASGGMVPCPAAIIMILLSWQLRVPELGLICLLSFSIGLASTLMTVGILAVSGARMIEKWLAARGSTKAVPLAAILPLIGGIVLLICGWLLLKV
jgi:ABC-type nickel/cobalt efflux system permease component RcnA